MGNDLSSNEIIDIISQSQKCTIISNSTPNENSSKNLMSILKTKNNSSIIIGIIVNEIYYLYNSYGNQWVKFYNISSYGFKFTQSYNCNNDDLFNIIKG